MTKDEEDQLLTGVRALAESIKMISTSVLLLNSKIKAIEEYLTAEAQRDQNNSQLN